MTENNFPILNLIGSNLKNLQSYDCGLCFKHFDGFHLNNVCGNCTKFICEPCRVKCVSFCKCTKGHSCVSPIHDSRLYYCERCIRPDKKSDNYDKKSYLERYYLLFSCFKYVLKLKRSEECLYTLFFSEDEDCEEDFMGPLFLTKYYTFIVFNDIEGQLCTAKEAYYKRMEKEKKNSEKQMMIDHLKEAMGDFRMKSPSEKETILSKSD
jgi:hypothetical protein